MDEGPIVDVDVIIVGGGVAGLLLLRELVERPDHPCTVLVTGASGVGAGQTGHSHVMIHQGHYLIGKCPIEGSNRRPLRHEPKWRASVAGVPGLDLPPLNPDQPLALKLLLERGARQWRNIWRDGPTGPFVPDSDALAGQVSYVESLDAGNYLKDHYHDEGNYIGDDFVVTGREDWCKPQELVLWLARGWGQGRLINDTASFHREGHELLVHAGGRRLRASTIVLAAGEANGGYLTSLARLAQDEATGDFYRVDSGGDRVTVGRIVRLDFYQLVMRGAADDGPSIYGRSAGGLSWTNGLKRYHGLLSCHGSSDGARTWVLTTGIPVASLLATQRWLPDVLRALATRFGIRDPRRLTWWFGKQAMHELAPPDVSGVAHWTIHEDAVGDSRVLFAWPTKLTLAPLLARDLAQPQRIPLVTSAKSAPSLEDVPTAAPAPWDRAVANATDSLQPWNAFLEAHRDSLLVPDELPAAWRNLAEPYVPHARGQARDQPVAADREQAPSATE